MDDLLQIAAGLPEVELGPGDLLVTEGGESGSVWVLESGVLTVHKSGVQVNTITSSGSIIGEVSVLLGSAPSASVVAAEPTRLRHAADGIGFLLANPQVLRAVATGLAERLDFVTTYLADLRVQYGDAPGLAMVPAVLQRLAGRDGPAASTGSIRDPDPEY